MQPLSTPSPAVARREHMHRAEPEASWKARAVADFGQHGDEDLAVSLLGAVRALTGQQVSPEHMWVSSARRAAAVSVDNIRFRWEQSQLVVLRPCVHCGLGQLASLALHSRADLGYALSAWQPRHPGCEQEDPTDW
ncbi:MAG: hypothetical protein HGA45_14480 [Chloroflexales bacterium]|nr:hypothetical protein [Chloroflexales bacterium]